MKINKRRGKYCFTCGEEAQIRKKADAVEVKGNVFGVATVLRAILRAVNTNRLGTAPLPEVRYCCNKAWVPNHGIKKRWMKQ